MTEHALRPAYKNSFHPALAKQIIKDVLTERLSNKTYNAELTSQWTRDIADDIKGKLKELNLERYKYVVNVAIGEQRGEGIRIGCRCFWDSDVDSSATETFMNVRRCPRPLPPPSRRARARTRARELTVAAPRARRARRRQESLFCSAIAFGVYLY
jgi:hypothetical protein